MRQLIADALAVIAVFFLLFVIFTLIDGLQSSQVGCG